MAGKERDEDVYYFLPQGIADDGDDDDSFISASSTAAATAPSPHFPAQPSNPSPFRASSPEPFRPAGSSNSSTPQSRQSAGGSFDNAQPSQQWVSSDEGMYDALSGGVYHGHQGVPQHHRPRSSEPRAMLQQRHGFRGACRSGANCSNPNCEYDHTSRDEASLYNFRVPPPAVVSSRSLSNEAPVSDFRVGHTDAVNSDGTGASVGTVAGGVRQDLARTASDDLTQDTQARRAPVAPHARPAPVQQPPARDARPEVRDVQNVRASIHVPPQPQHTNAFASAPKEVWPTLNRLYAQTNPPPPVASPSPRRTATVTSTATSSTSNGSSQSKRSAKKAPPSGPKKISPEQQARGRTAETDAFVQVSGKKQGQRQRKPRPLPTKIPAISLVQASAFSVLSMRDPASLPDPDPNTSSSPPSSPPPFSPPLAPLPPPEASGLVSPIITRQKKSAKRASSAPTTPKNPSSPKSTSSSPKAGLTTSNSTRKTRRRSKSKSPSSSRPTLGDLPASVASVLGMQKDREAAHVTVASRDVTDVSISHADISDATAEGKSANDSTLSVFSSSRSTRDTRRSGDEVPLRYSPQTSDVSCTNSEEKEHNDKKNATQAIAAKLASPPPVADDANSSGLHVSGRSSSEENAPTLSKKTLESATKQPLKMDDSEPSKQEALDACTNDASGASKPPKSAVKKSKNIKDASGNDDSSTAMQSSACVNSTSEISSIRKPSFSAAAKDLASSTGLRGRAGGNKRQQHTPTSQVERSEDEDEEEFDDEHGDIHMVQSSDVDMGDGDGEDSERGHQDDDTTVLFNLNLLLTAVAALGSLLEKGKNAANGGPLRHALFMFHQIGSIFLGLVWSVVSVLAATHKHAMGVLALDHHLAFCFTFLYVFPYLVHYMTYWAPPWAAPCLWYAFLMQVFCTQGSPFLVSLFRLLLPLLFLTEGVSHHVLLLELNGAERLVVAYVLASFRTQEFYRPAFLLALTFEIVAALVQWGTLILSLLVKDAAFEAYLKRKQVIVTYNSSNRNRSNADNYLSSFLL